MNLGANDTRIVPRNKDKGADIIEKHPPVAGVLSQTVAVRVKHWGPASPNGNDIVDQLIMVHKCRISQLGSDSDIR